MMNRRTFIVTAAGVLAAPLVGETQKADKVRKIGWLSTGAPTPVGFLQGLQELGWVERENLVIERRSAEGDPARLPALATELVRLRVEIIVAGDSATIRPASPLYA
jgi:hypothetical protein